VLSRPEIQVRIGAAACVLTVAQIICFKLRFVFGDVIHIRRGFVKNNRTPLIRTLVIRIANYPDRFDPSGKFVENSKKKKNTNLPLNYRYRINYIRVLWVLELLIRRGH